MAPTISSVDAGLFYGSLLGSKADWQSAFPEDNFADYGPIHIWIRRIDLDMRAFFFVENVEEGIFRQVSINRFADN